MPLATPGNRPHHLITRISNNSHYQRLYICILFRSDKQLLWYVYDFPIFLDPKILSVICICFGCYYFKNTWSGLFFSFFLTFQESVYFFNCWEYYQLFIKIMLKNQQVTTWLDYKLLFYITIILQIKLHNYTIIDNFLKWNF